MHIVNSLPQLCFDWIFSMSLPLLTFRMLWTRRNAKTGSQKKCFTINELKHVKNWQVGPQNWYSTNYDQNQTGHIYFLISCEHFLSFLLYSENMTLIREHPFLLPWFIVPCALRNTCWHSGEFYIFQFEANCLYRRNSIVSAVLMTLLYIGYFSSSSLTLIIIKIQLIKPEKWSPFLTACIIITNVSSFFRLFVRCVISELCLLCFIRMQTMIS